MRVLTSKSEVKIYSDTTKIIKGLPTKVVSHAMQGEMGVNAQNLKSLSIISPLAGEDVVLFYTDVALSVKHIVFNVNGGSLDWNLGFSTERSGTLTKVFTADKTTPDMTESINLFDNDSIPANSFIRFVTSDKVGTVQDIHLTLLYLLA